MVGVNKRGKDLVVDLNPLPRWEGSPPRACLDFTANGKQLWLSGTLVRTGDTEDAAQFLVTRGPELRPDRAPRVVPAIQVAFAIFTAPASGIGRRCEPVLDIGMRAMRIESAVPMDVGTILTDLIVMSGQECIRRGEGSVIACAMVFCPDGRRIHECTVRLRSRTTVSAPSTDAEKIEITDLPRVRAVLWGLCDLEYDIIIFSGSEATTGRLQHASGDRSSMPRLTCHMTAPDHIANVTGVVTVECSLFGSGYRFFARVVSRLGSVVTLAPAPKLREWHRRDEDRTPIVSGCDATVSFRHPLAKIRCKRRLVDVSSHGFAFQPDGQADELWPSLPLKDVRLQLPNLTIRIDDAIIQAVSAGRCGVQTLRLSETDADALRVRLIEMSPGPVELHDGERLDSVVSFHRSMNLLEEDMDASLNKTFQHAQRSWRIGHQSGLMRTAIIPWHGGIGATLTSVQAYDNSWILQHSAVASPAVPAGAGQLHGLLMRLAAHRREGEYVAGFIDSGAKSLHAMVNTFFAEAAPAHRGANRFVLFSAAAKGGLTHSMGTDVRRLGAKDELLVEHVGQRQLDPVCARALSLRRGEVELPRTSAAYRKLGLERRREAFGAFDGNHCVAILLREVASPGLCLSGLLSAGMLLPVLPAADPTGSRRRQLCDLLRGSDLPGSPPFRFLFVPEGSDEAPLVGAGFRRIGECTFFALHRFGLLDYQRYVSNKYGLLQARMRGRVGRVSKAA